MKKIFYLVSLLTMMLLSAAPVIADVTYNYSGKPYNYFSSNPPDASLGTNLTASFTFDSNVVTTDYTGYQYFVATENNFNNITSWSATSGAITLSSQAGDYEAGAMFQFINGDIVSWYFAVGSNPGYYIASYNSVNIYDIGANYYVNQDNMTWSAHYGSDYGTWAKQGSSNQVPEPATMLLFGLGLAGLAGLRKKI